MRVDFGAGEIEDAMTETELLDDARDKIWLSGKGISHDSFFSREFAAAGGDLRMLLDCVADNICEENEDGETIEHIDWTSALDDYKTMRKFLCKLK